MYDQIKEQNEKEVVNNKLMARDRLVMARKERLKCRKRVRAKKQSSKDSDTQFSQKKSLAGNVFHHFNSIVLSLRPPLEEPEGEGDEGEVKKEAKVSSLCGTILSTPRIPSKPTTQGPFLSLIFCPLGFKQACSERESNEQFDDDLECQVGSPVLPAPVI